MSKKINQEVYTLITNSVLKETYSENDFKKIYKEILKKEKKSINSIQQVILKILNNTKILPRNIKKHFENFFREMFIYFLKKKNNKNNKLDNFFLYFINFFATGIQSGNHQIRLMFSEFLILLLQKGILKNLKISKKELKNLLDSCLCLISENNITRKKLAIKILSFLQNENFIKNEVKNLLIQIIAEEKFSELRKLALKKILLEKNNISFISHRTKDNNSSIRNLLIQKLIKSEFTYKDLDCNSLYFVIYNCIFMNSKSLENDLIQFLLPFKDDEEIKKFNEKFQNENKNNKNDNILNENEIKNFSREGFCVNSIFEILMKFNLDLILVFEKVYSTLKQLVFVFFENFKIETFEFFIEKIVKFIFDKNNIDKEIYKYHLFLFLMLIFFLNEKIQIKEEEKSSRKSRNSLNLDQELKKYNKISQKLNNNLPTMLKTVEIIEQIFKRKNKIIEKQIILQYSLITTLDEVSRLKLIKFLKEFVKNFKIENFYFEESLKKVNKLVEEEIGRENLDKNKKDCFIQEVNNLDLCHLYFLRRDNPEFIPLIFEFDILTYVFKTLYFYLSTNEENLFLDFIKNLLEEKNKDKNDMENKFFSGIILQFAFFNINSPSKKSISIFSKLIKNLFIYSKKNISENPIKFLFFELILLKSVALMIFNSIEQFHIHGKIFYEYFERENKIEHRLLSYAIFFDFLLTHNYNNITRKRQELILKNEKELEESSEIEILDLSIVLEKMRKKICEEKSPILVNMLINGFCKLIYNNPEIFKSLGIEKNEIFSLLLLFWKNENFDNTNLLNLATKQTISIFFLKTNYESEKNNYNVVKSFLTVSELIFIMQKRDENFIEEKLFIDIKDNYFLKDIIKTCINLTCLEEHNFMQKWKYSSFYGFKPQELLFLFFLDNKENYLEIINELVTYFSFWNFSKEIILFVFLKKLEEFGKAKKTSYKNLKKLYFKIFELIQEKKIDENIILNDEEQKLKDNDIDFQVNELNGILCDYWDSIKSGTIVFHKSLKRDFNVIEKIEN